MRLLLVALLSLGLSMFSQTAFAQAGGGSTTGGGGGAGTGTAPPGNPGGPNHGEEIDLPIGAPQDGYSMEWEDDDPPDEDDGPSLYDEDLPTETDSLIYVIDISGSMDWGNSSYTGLDGNPTSGTKLDRAKVELIRSVGQLTDDFEFNVVAYDCNMRRWAPARQKADAGNKTSAAQWVGGLSAGGATGTGPATALALGDKENYTVILLSDGAPNCGASGTSGHLSMIAGANTQGATIHTFGIAATGQFEAFLRTIADTTGGRYYPVP